MLCDPRCRSRIFRAMRRSSRSTRPSRRPQQGGFIYIILASFLSVSAAFMVAQTARPEASRENDRKNANVMQHVKDALIAYAVTQVVVRNPNSSPLLPVAAPTRPGELPCPDLDGDGYEDLICVAGAVGRVPWRTLAIQEPKDATGETLWYAVAGPFRRLPLGAAQINSDTVGNLTVRGANGAPITNTGAAVIFAPGPPLPGQARISAPLLPANFLEAYRDDVGTVIGNNGLIGGPLVIASASSSFNDQVAVLTTSELIPRVELRVATEVRQILDQYQKNSEHGTLPWAVSFDSLSTISAVGVNRGRLPLLALPDNWGSVTSEGKTLPSLPNWFIANGWRDYLYYTFSGLLMLSQRSSCTTCTSDFLSLGGGAGYLALIFTPGTSLVGPRTYTRLNHYLETNDAADDQYVVPPYVKLDQDRVTYIPTLPRTQCQGVGTQLAALAPCGQPSRINGMCLRLATQLQACGCAAAAVQLITTPCENTLNPAVCREARTGAAACG